MTNPEPSPPDALPADAVPPELSELVQRSPDGHLTFTRLVPTPDRARRYAAIGVVPFAVGLLAGITGVMVGSVEGLALAVPLALGGPMVGLMAASSAMTRLAEAVATPDGLQGEVPIAWAPARCVRLVGSPSARRAMLVLVRPDGTVEEIKTWLGLASHRAHGWDHDSVRWFAARIAELAGTFLEDDLKDVERWTALEAHRDEVEKLDHAHLHAANPVAAREAWSSDGVEVYVAGKTSRLVLAEGATSYDPKVPIRVTSTHVIVGTHRLLRSEIHGIQAWFGSQKIGRHVEMGIGQIRAKLDHGHWVLAERALHVGGGGAGEILGAAAAIEAAWKAGGVAKESGEASEVPEAMRQMASAARGRTEREPG